MQTYSWGVSNWLTPGLRGQRSLGIFFSTPFFCLEELQNVFRTFLYFLFIFLGLIESTMQGDHCRKLGLPPISGLLRCDCELASTSPAVAAEKPAFSTWCSQYLSFEFFFCIPPAPWTVSGCSLLAVFFCVCTCALQMRVATKSLWCSREVTRFHFFSSSAVFCICEVFCFRLRLCQKLPTTIYSKVSGESVIWSRIVYFIRC